MQHYQHRQPGTLIVASVSAALLLCLVIFIQTIGEGTAAELIVGSVFLLLLVVLWIFRSLNVEVDSETVFVAFGSGLIRREIQITDIEAARTVRNNPIFGWGIRWIPRGWMFNVSGLDAVELEFAGGRKFRIGTDDPENLLAAITSACESCGK